MNEERVQAIEAAISAQEARGQQWSNLSVYGSIGGNYAELSQYLKARRAQGRGPGRGGGAAEAVADETTQHQAPTSLQEELEAAQDAEQFAEARLSLLEEKATREMLSTDEEIEVLRLERRLGTLAAVITRLHREIEQAKEEVDVEAFVQAWQPTVDHKRALYAQFFQDLRQVFTTFLAIADQHDKQIEGLQRLPPRLARFMLENFLPDTGTLKSRIAGGMVTPGAWHQILGGPSPLQVAPVEQLMEGDPGTRALPPRLIQNAINANKPVDRSA